VATPGFEPAYLYTDKLTTQQPPGLRRNTIALIVKYDYRIIETKVVKLKQLMEAGDILQLDCVLNSWLPCSSLRSSTINHYKLMTQSLHHILLHSITELLIND